MTMLDGSTFNPPKVDKSDEAQVMALAGWFRDNPRVVDPLTPDETEAERAIRALETMAETTHAFEVIQRGLATIIDAPRDAGIRDLLGAVADENEAVRKALTEVLDYVRDEDRPTADQIDTWAAALERPWLVPFNMVRVSMSYDPETRTMTATFDEGEDDEPDCGECPPCKRNAAREAEAKGANES